MRSVYSYTWILIYFIFISFYLFFCQNTKRTFNFDMLYVLNGWHTWILLFSPYGERVAKNARTYIQTYTHKRKKKRGTKTKKRRMGRKEGKKREKERKNKKGKDLHTVVSSLACKYGLGLCPFSELVCDLLPRRLFHGSPKAHCGRVSQSQSWWALLGGH